MKTEVLADLVNPDRLTVIASVEDVNALERNEAYVRRVIITPLGALAMLEFNTNNRRLKQNKVDRLVQSIIEGHWFLSPDAITFDRNGVVINGQHRLQAAVEANRAIEVLMLSGADPASRQIVDTGTRRSLADALVMNGVTSYAHGLAAAANLHYRYTHRNLALTNTGTVGSYDRPGHDVMLDYIGQHPEIGEATSEGMALYLNHRAFSASAATCFVAISRGIDAGLSDEFITKLIAGTNMAEDDPVLALSKLLRNMHNQVGRRRAEWSLAAAIKAWNYTRHGRAVRVISVRSNETYPEAI